MNGFLYSMLIIFTVAGPFLIQVDMHYSAIAFGKMALFVGLCWFLGATTNRLTIDIPHGRKFLICLLSLLFIAVSMLITTVYFKMNIYILLVPILLMAWLGGIIFPNNMAKVFTLFPTITGSANALFGGLTFIITGMTTFLATCLQSSTLIPIALCYVGLMSLCLMIYFISRK
jgi:hypothetical protein